MNKVEEGSRYIVSFKMKDGVSELEKTKLRRKLYGWVNYSQYGKYRYKREGILGDIAHRRVLPGVIITTEEGAKRVKHLLGGEATIWTGKLEEVME